MPNENKASKSERRAAAAPRRQLSDLFWRVQTFSEESKMNLLLVCWINGSLAIKGHKIVLLMYTPRSSALCLPSRTSCVKWELPAENWIHRASSPPLTSVTLSPTLRAYWSRCWGSSVSAGWQSHDLGASPHWWGDRTFSPPPACLQRTERS